MYHIVGADNQPHGSIDAATVNQWITEGRANGQTMTCTDGAQEWKPLATFSEFAPALVQAPPFAGGILMFIPILGVLFSIGTLVMGIKGLKNVKENPVVRGTAHAWIAVIGGGLEIIVGLFFTVVFIIGIIASR